MILCRGDGVIGNIETNDIEQGLVCLAIRQVPAFYKGKSDKRGTCPLVCPLINV